MSHTLRRVMRLRRANITPVNLLQVHPILSREQCTCLRKESRHAKEMRTILAPMLPESRTQMNLCMAWDPAWDFPYLR